MKLLKLFKLFHKRQNGHVFITALIILVLGTFLLVPLLGFMSTGLKTSQAFEEETYLLYAADAGIEDALW
jgi:Tfp pilus assembly protein PilX